MWVWIFLGIAAVALASTGLLALMLWRKGKTLLSALEVLGGRLDDVGGLAAQIGRVPEVTATPAALRPMLPAGDGRMERHAGRTGR